MTFKCDLRHFIHETGHLSFSIYKCLESVLGSQREGVEQGGKDSTRLLLLGKVIRVMTVGYPCRLSRDNIARNGLEIKDNDEKERYNPIVSESSCTTREFGVMWF